MADKKVSAIQAVTLNTATFENETFTPTYINFFYGKNGAGKTSLGRQLGEGAGLQWAPGESPANYEIHLYNQDFIDQHFRTLDRLRGVFSLSEGKGLWKNKWDRTRPEQNKQRKNRGGAKNRPGDTAQAPKSKKVKAKRVKK